MAQDTRLTAKAENGRNGSKNVSTMCHAANQMPHLEDNDTVSVTMKSNPVASKEATGLHMGEASVTEIQATMDKLTQQEAIVTARLDALLVSQNAFKHELSRLDILRANLGSQAVSTRSIGTVMLSQAAGTARRLSAAVNQLDLEQARVKGTLNVVEQVAELKTCVLGVTGSMGAAQDWEAAATYLHRASQIPSQVLNGSFAEEIVPTAEVPDPPQITLAQAAESLRGFFLGEFEEAAKENNGSKVTRFFKLFPLIGKPDVGLDVYGRYVCQGVATRARSNLNAGTGGLQSTEGFFYANALTKLFEHIAQIVEHHGGLVRIHYGEGRMVRILERLQMEADVQGGIIIDTWSDERSLDRKLTDIRSYAFTFLVQSFLPAPAARTSTPRAGSPMRKGALEESSAQTEESVDTKEVDALLSEMTVMVARWSLYCRLIALKSKGESDSQRSEDEVLSIPPLLARSGLAAKVADRLITPINVMATFLLRRSVERAFQLDEQPLGLSLNPSKAMASNPPYMSSAVDDVMYIVDQVVERSLATSQRLVISSVIPSVARVLDSDFIGMIQRKMRDESYPKAAIPNTLPPESTIIAFLVLTNDLDIANDYVKRIVRSRVPSPGSEDAGPSPQSLDSLFPFGDDALYATRTLISLQRVFEAKTSELISDGIYVIFKNVIKPRLRPLLSDAFRDIDYQMNEAEEANRSIENDQETGEGADGAAEYHFQRGWDALNGPIKRIFTDGNFDRLLSTTISYLAEVLEKRIWSYYGRINDLGAVRLERAIASLINVVVRGGRYGLRDAFIRCTQICLVMNMEADEWAETQSLAKTDDEGDGAEWKLNVGERTRARSIVQNSKSTDS
ncbi:MAG: hypothetical protein Q9184_001604 [Pyrenodesmia sp. 2 TL-2023]